MLLALTGRRHAGKSTAARYLAEKHGFQPFHAFQIGKDMAELYFFRVTGSRILANRMVNGDLKDKPSEHLPGNAKPRDFLERFGAFMGQDMGPEWTLGMELAVMARENPGADLVCESIIYESEPLRESGAYLVRLERVGYDHPEVESDATQAAIAVHHTLRAESLQGLYQQLDILVEWLRDAPKTFG